MPADPSSPIPAALTQLAHPDPRQLQDAEAPHLLAYLASVPDPRATRGRRHPLAASVWANDSVLSPRIEPVVMLAAVVPLTTRVTLGTATLLPVLRRPVQAAQALASLGLLSGGRLAVGVGAGFPGRFGAPLHALSEVPWPGRFARLDDTVALWRQLWSRRGPNAFHGKVLHFNELPQGLAPYRPAGPPVGRSIASFARVVRAGGARGPPTRAGGCSTQWPANAPPGGCRAACLLGGSRPRASTRPTGPRHARQPGPGGVMTEPGPPVGESEAPPPSDPPGRSPRPSRRQLLAATGGLMAGAAGGLAGGVFLGHDANPPPLRPSGRRRFEDKVVLITGATSGIGRAAAIAFAAEGAKVGFCGRRTNHGRQVEREIRSAGGEAMYVRADVLVERDVQSFVDQVVDRYNGLHVAFNNAGISIEKPLHEMTSEEFDQVVNTNLRGTFLAMKYEIPHMLAGGGGVIVIISSSNALATNERRSAYSASKRGLVGLMQSATFDYAAKGIRVNALIPGTTDTALIRRAAGMEDVPDAAWRVFIRQWAKSHVPGLGRVATPEEVASFALVLASDDHPYMSGAQLVIDGGKTAHAG